MQARQSSNLKMLLRCKNPLNFGGFQKSHKITMDPPNFWFLRHSVQKTKARNPTGGDGGNGCTSFHRSRYDRRDKADGGNGGRGGDVILECSPTVWDLSKRATSHKCTERGTWNFKK